MVVLLPQKRFFERFWMNSSSPLTVPYNMEQSTTLMWSWIYHKFKNIHLRKNSLNEYFKAISHFFRVYSLSGFIMNMLIFSSSRWSLCHHSFSVLKIFHCEDFWPLFELGTMGTQNAWWRHAEWCLLEFVCGLLLGNCGYQTDRKKDLWPKQNRTWLVIRAGQNYKLASVREL